MDIQKILQEGGSLEATLPIEGLEWERGEHLEARPATLRGKLVRVRRGFELQAHLLGGVTLECARCLSPFAFKLSCDFRLVLVTQDENPPERDAHIQNADCDYYPCTKGKVDLSALVKEQIYLQIPLKPICEESCRGLCRDCGDDLNSGRCRCGEPAGVRVV